MSDTTSNDKTIRVGTRKPLSLKRDTDTVRQSFSGGRTKAVLVEKKRSRVAGPPKRPDLSAPVVDEASKPAESTRPQAQPRRGDGAPSAPTAPTAPAAPRSRAGGMVLRTLTDEERDARAHALQEARVREAE